MCLNNKRILIVKAGILWLKPIIKSVFILATFVNTKIFKIKTSFLNIYYTDI